MTQNMAESIYRSLLRADREQESRSRNSGRVHPTFTHRWRTADAIRCQEVLGPERTQAIRYEEYAAS